MNEEYLNINKDRANILAYEIRRKAEQKEPKITKDMLALENEYAHLEGLNYRLKSEESIARKILFDSIDDNISLEMASSYISDSIRYTLITDIANYKNIVECSLDILANKGYKMNKFKNFWGNDLYQGINVSIITPEEIKIELQFHTIDSYEAKGNHNHALYEIVRNKFASETEQFLATTIMAKKQSNVLVPTGIIGYKYGGN